MSAALGPSTTAKAWLEALDERQISARELLSLYRRRIEQHDPALNVVVVTDFERAERGALEADERRASGSEGALLGLPVTLKESMNVAGLRTTVGVPLWESYVAPQDGAIAQRVRGAGGVILGKTNVPPMLEDWEANNPVYGRSNNPWDLERTPGGSSAGASAVAAGLTPLDFGSDIGGSLRVPAVFSGVYAHKPSETALPRSGQFPVPPAPNSATSMGVQGPLARSAQDLELAFDAVSGADVGEQVAWRLALPPARQERLSSYRVAVLPDVDWVPVCSELRAAQERLLRTLRDAGCKLGVAQPETWTDPLTSFALYLRLLMVMTSVRTPAEARANRVAALRKAGHVLADAQAEGLAASASDYLSWQVERERVRAAYRSLFREWDVLLCPAFPTLAPPHSGRRWPPEPGRAATLNVDGREHPALLGLFHASLATLPGQPATTFPLGLSPAGLPVGLQAIGRYLEDRTPLRFAALVAERQGGFIAPPRFA